MQAFYAEKIEIYFLFMHFAYILLYTLNFKHVFLRKTPLHKLVLPPRLKTIRIHALVALFHFIFHICIFAVYRLCQFWLQFE